MVFLWFSSGFCRWNSPNSPPAEVLQHPGARHHLRHGIQQPLWLQDHGRGTCHGSVVCGKIHPENDGKMIGTCMETCGRIYGNMIGKCWENDGKMIGQLWEHDGNMMGTWWENIGHMIEKWWRNDGTCWEKVSKFEKHAENKSSLAKNQIYPGPS